MKRIVAAVAILTVLLSLCACKSSRTVSVQISSVEPDPVKVSWEVAQGVVSTYTTSDWRKFSGTKRTVK